MQGIRDWEGDRERAGNKGLEGDRERAGNKGLGGRPGASRE